MKKRVHVYYSGMVQGVGFRFTAERVAMSLDLTGWVKNIRDGRVEVVCEGDEACLVDFLNKMKSGSMKQYITGARAAWEEATGEFSDFEIRFY